MLKPSQTTQGAYDFHGAYRGGQNFTDHPAMHRVADEAMQRRDRRFFAKNSKRRHYVRFASEIEEAGYRQMADIPMEEPGICIAIVQQIAPGARRRRLEIVPEFENCTLVLPRDEAECAALAEAFAIGFKHKDQAIRIFAMSKEKPPGE